MDAEIELIPVFTKEMISQRVAEIAAEISADFAARDLVLIGVLKGAFIFLADLSRCLSIPATIDFIHVSSYRNSITSSEQVELTKEIGTDIKGKDVLIVEDIVDTGLTIKFLLEHLNRFGPSRIKVCTLLDKPSRRKTPIQIDYCCYVVDEGFIVGYGLDYAEQYRYLPTICHLKL